MQNPNSLIERTKYVGRETTTLIMEADNLSVRFDEGEQCLVLELFRSGEGGRLVEGYAFKFCPEDRERVRRELNDHHRRHSAAVSKPSTQGD